jgi:2-amino-4-hydroxy-6-hydroxymethyldihydropteridine diphosphokinase
VIIGIGVGASGPGAAARVDRAILTLDDTRALTLLARSDVREGPGVGTRPGAWFANAAVLVETSLFPRDLLRLLHAAERRAGRVRGARNAPRTLDLDVLWSSAGPLKTRDLEVPHPRLRGRPFALEPLRDCFARAGLEARYFRPYFSMR